MAAELEDVEGEGTGEGERGKPFKWRRAKVDWPGKAKRVYHLLGWESGRL